ncbi:hypothetical protein GGR43_004127 [Sphingobium jiangsuense]|uniref:Uncharacterized protein n=1 Tax=Sphingobium jiangsuense TaxID=870476 RepID=A0A7W6BK66_9SPHN|nr:hypothetical protein [Sphingobium jiangsuense]
MLRFRQMKSPQKFASVHINIYSPTRIDAQPLA